MYFTILVLFTIHILLCIIYITIVDGLMLIKFLKLYLVNIWGVLFYIYIYNVAIASLDSLDFLPSSNLNIETKQPQISMIVDLIPGFKCYFQVFCSNLICIDWISYHWFYHFVLLLLLDLDSLFKFFQKFII